ncbi:MAG: hypothetical protein KAG61_08995 [Bacteriovoracaceae bacterium]|nr:hypothetical protein [Bacteriovoracaceae bacterium]
MSKKGHGKAEKKKLTKKEQKRLNHLNLVKGSQDKQAGFDPQEDKKKKAA